ncbi:50s ribosomal protein L22 [Mitosporidium daphniae]|uniref:50s ribosomal protein L22 n=1 Tax=Mitosporidium daphniae TaxID=1485682 RepID=A0A098VW11_9MICR|nr:50s ribosomal protein L22 [Mitosporidium daphniae]KGG53064.1 50s ribosomal protein L22 [Mitosporidium daphniae]|eukprot:XP_013239500.1 50s ribosomal protein L22 [Mitosporidium daphniae]
MRNRKLALAAKYANHPGARLLDIGEKLAPLCKEPRGSFSAPYNRKNPQSLANYSSPQSSKKIINLNSPYTGHSVSVNSGWAQGSPKRLNFISQMVRGLSIEDAILQMTFSKKRAARRLLATLVRLRTRARVEKAPLDHMVLSSLTVGRGKITREIDIKGRGRHGIKKHYHSQVRVTLSEPNYEREFKKHYKIPRFVEHKSVLARIDY